MFVPAEGMRCAMGRIGQLDWNYVIKQLDEMFVCKKIVAKRSDVWF